MKGAAGYLLLALSAAGACGALGFLYGSLCAILAGSREKIARVRLVDCRIWTRAGPIMAVVVLVGALMEGRVWYEACAFAAVAWVAAAAMRGGIYWSTTRRLARAVE